MDADFSSPTIAPWQNASQGDYTDIGASNSSGQADILIIGDNGSKEISNVFSDPSKWEAKAWYGGTGSNIPVSANVTDLNGYYSITLTGLE